MKYVGKNGLKVIDKNVWHEGNFDPKSKWEKFAPGVATKPNANEDIYAFVLEPYLITNKLWFYDTDLFLFEGSDDGVAYSTISVSNSSLGKILANYNPETISLNLSNYKFYRVTITGNSNRVTLIALQMKMITRSKPINVVLERYKNSTSAWETFLNSQWAGGYPDTMTLKHASFQLHPTYTSSNGSSKVRITISYVDGSNTRLAINSLRWYGTFSFEDDIANKRDIFTWDYDKNVIFPAEIKAGTFRNSSGTEVAYKTELANKADKSQVLTNVPANAKFTDTTYSEISESEINTGTASTLRTITARRIKFILDKVQGWINGLTKSDVGLSNVDNTSDLNKPISSATQIALDNKADKSQVLTNVPINAKFTDTIYTHPSSHPASMITESTSRRFASDTEKAAWNNKAELSDIPTKVSELTNDSNYVTQCELGDAGFGDMMKCYNVDTDILTDKGFINITQLTKQDNVATLNPSNSEIIYQPVKNIYKYNNVDKLYEISSQQIDLSVTLNHKMYIRRRDRECFELVEAKDIIGKRVEYKKDGIWKGEYSPCIEIEGVKIPIELYAEFMGYYISEGCTINAVNGQDAKDYLMCITQVKSKTQERMFKVTEQVAFLFGRNAFVNNNRNIKISDKRLYNHLQPLGKSYEKYIPDVIMNSTQEIIRIFLEAYVDGDGNRKNDCNRKTEQWSIFTTSKKMADQLQELALKAGWSANISEINKIGDISYINGRKVISRHVCYRIGFNKRKNTPMVNHGHVKRQNAQSEGIVEYGGNVIGVEVAKHHTLYVRRNGKAVWSGNSIYDQNNNGIVDNAEKVGGFTVGANVPSNAKFTDTIYTHPSSHPASMITESTTKRFVSDAEKTTWNNKANASDIPNKFVHVGTSQPTNNQMGWVDTSL